jgi:hypothetical protein
MPMLTCPFCGIPADAPHETQEGCIEALQAEIARVRAILDRVHSVKVPGPADDDDPAAGSLP